MYSLELARARSPALPASPATLTSISIAQARARALARGARARAAPTRDASEWIRRTCGTIRLHAPALQLADEVPLEQLAVGGELVLEVLRAVLADQLDAGLGQRAAAPRRRRTWSRRAAAPSAARGPPLRGAAPRRSRRACSRGSRAPARRDAGDQLNHAIPAWRPARCAFAAVREEPLVADRARVDVADRRRRRRRAGARAAIARRSSRAAARGGARERGVHLGSDLVAADAGAGADRPPRSAARPRRARAARCTPCLEHAGGEPAPAGVEHRDGAVAAERDRQAVGGEHHRTDSRQRRRVAVGVDRHGRSARAGDLVDDVHGRAVHLTARAQPAQPHRAHIAPRAARVPCAWSSPRAVERLPSARVVNSARPPPGSSNGSCAGLLGHQRSIAASSAAAARPRGRLRARRRACARARRSTWRRSPARARRRRRAGRRR